MMKQNDIVGTGRTKNPCPACGRHGYQDVAIHDGQSVRRECDTYLCWHFIQFVKWYGEPVDREGVSP